MAEEQPMNPEGPADGVLDGEVQSNWDEITPTFDQMDLKEDLLRGIYAYGFEKPSAIQHHPITT